jgi:hypothetical protein
MDEAKSRGGGISTINTFKKHPVKATAEVYERWIKTIEMEITEYRDLLNSLPSTLAHAQAVVLTEVLGR